MRTKETLKFIITVIAILFFLCIVFPKDGIKIGKTTLTFPTVHQVLVHEKKKKMDDLLVKEEKRDLSGIRDTIDDCKHRLFEMQTRIWLPKDDICFFDNFFARAEKAQEQNRTVRILHYGDSQIEQDRISCRLRERFRLVFGGGGPGMIPLRQPIATFSFIQSVTGSIHGQSTYGDSSYSRADGNYGPMLRCWRLTGTANMSLNSTKDKHAADGVRSFSTLTVLFNNRPGPLSVNMTDRIGGGTYSKSVSKEGIHTIRWQMDSATTSAAITLNGTADIYGVLVDNGGGVAVDNISMRGVSGHQFRMANLEQLTKAYSLMDVGIIIMQFGGNSVPYLKTDAKIETYCKNLGEQIDYVHNACPNAAILFIGPSDMSTNVNGQMATYPKLPKLVEELRKMANSHNAAFWSIYDAMGGHNSMLSWVSEGYAGRDYIHFTRKGSDVMGDYLSDLFMTLYELYNMRKRITKDEFKELWEVENGNK